MRVNGISAILLLLAVTFFLPSCSLSKKTSKYRYDNTSVEEYGEKLYGKKKKTGQDEWSDKTVLNDTIVREGQESIIMPDAVDVSEYEPEFKKKKKKKKEKPAEPEISEPIKPSIAGVSRKESKLRQDMVDFGKKYLGVPYKYAGKKPSTGFDCSGLTCYIYQEFGMKIGAASRFQANDGTKIKTSQTLPGDLVIFGKSGKINHVAMVVRNDDEGLFVIHSTSRGVVIDNILKSSYWKPRIMYARRVIGE